MRVGEVLSYIFFWITCLSVIVLLAMAIVWAFMSNDNSDLAYHQCTVTNFNTQLYTCQNLYGTKFPCWLTYWYIRDENNKTYQILEDQSVLSKPQISPGNHPINSTAGCWIDEYYLYWDIPKTNLFKQLTFIFGVVSLMSCCCCMLNLYICSIE